MDPALVLALTSLAESQTALNNTLIDLARQQQQANQVMLPIVHKMGEVFTKAEPLIDNMVELGLESLTAQVNEEMDLRE